MDRPLSTRPTILEAEAAPERAADRAVPGSDRAEPRGLTRRSALQGIAAGLGAGFAFPLSSDAGHDHPVVAHAAQRQTESTPAEGGEPEFLDPHQFATLTVLAELIVPGAQASASDRFIDISLAIETPDTQQRFVTALGAVDGAAISRHRQPFKALSSADQVALLEEAFAQESGRPEPKPWQPGDPVVPPAQDRGRETLTLRDHVEHLKGWIAGAHYSSEAGMKELGWTGNMFFESFPGCTHPDGHRSA